MARDADARGATCAAVAGAGILGEQYRAERAQCVLVWADGADGEGEVSATRRERERKGKEGRVMKGEMGRLQFDGARSRSVECG